MKLCRGGTWEVFLLLNLTAYPTKLELSIVRLRLYQSAFKAIGFWETSRTNYPNLNYCLMSALAVASITILPERIADAKLKSLIWNRILLHSKDLQRSIYWWY